MSVEITHVRFEDNTSRTESTIAAYQYKQDASGAVDSKWKADMVAYLEGGMTAFVGSGSNRVAVAVVDHSPKFLRTHADGKWNNNLLNLDTF